MKHAISVFRLTVPFVFHTKGYVMKKNISIKIPYSETAGIKSSLFKSMIAIAALLLPLLFASCTSSVELHTNGDGSINILYDAAFDSAFIEIMQSLSGESGTQLFDADEMTSQFRAAGIKDVRVASPANTSLGIALRLPKEGNDPISRSGCISRSARSLAITVSPASCAKLYKLLPDTLQSYIDLFMAPVFLGEAVPKDEYVDLIASVYGKALADEASRAKIKISFFAPNGEKAVKTIECPLVDLLTAAKPLVFSAAW